MKRNYFFIGLVVVFILSFGCLLLPAFDYLDNSYHFPDKNISFFIGLGIVAAAALFCLTALKIVERLKK